jgi:hypothetical protein
MLRSLFGLAARGLPLARLAELHRPAAARPEPAFRRTCGNSGS